MDAILKDKWVKALRSGEYQQGVYSFKRDDKFCCLGVLCEVAQQPPVVELECGNWSFVNQHLDNSAQRVLYEMNDTGISFGAIADYIEANIPVEAA